jgi:D-amino-acid dehydrogenase
MRVAVIGAGIVGIATAHELARSGHQVSVYEQRSTAAEEASFAITGMRGAAYAAAFAFNSQSAQFGRDFWSAQSGLRLGRGLHSRQWAWLWSWLRANKKPSDAEQRAALLQLARMSGDALDDLTHELGLEYEQCEGYTVLLRNDLEHAAGTELVDELKGKGIACSLLDAEALRKHELALNPDTPVNGAIVFPAEKTANCRQVALLLKKECDAMGVQFFFDHKVDPLKPGNASTLHVQTSDGMHHTHVFDAVVVCAGQGSGLLVADVCPRLPEIEVHGYSISAHIREPLNAPRTTCFDMQHRAHISRLGQRVRVGGLALIGTPTPAKRLAALRTLYKVLLDWFPGACQMQRVQEWSGTRICTPDGLPIIGAAPEKGVWLNMAHGDLGWTLAQGSAAGINAMIAAKPLGGVEWSHFSPTRFAKA